MTDDLRPGVNVESAAKEHQDPYESLVRLIRIDVAAVAVLHPDGYVVRVRAEEFVVGRHAVKHMPGLFRRAGQRWKALENVLVIGKRCADALISSRLRS